MQQAKALIASQKYSEAIALLDVALSKSPDLRLLDLRAIAKDASDQWRTALTDAQQMVRLAPDKPMGYYRAAKILAKRGKYDKARAFMQEAIIRSTPTAQTVLQNELAQIVPSQLASNLFDSLPVEVIALIFKYNIASASGVANQNLQLSRLQRVCRRFHDIIEYDATFWQRFEVVSSHRRNLQKMKRWQDRLGKSHLTDLVASIDSFESYEKFALSKGMSLSAFAGHALTSLSCKDITEDVNALIHNVASNLVHVSLGISRCGVPLEVLLQFFPRSRTIRLGPRGASWQDFDIGPYEVLHPYDKNRAHPIEEITMLECTISSEAGKLVRGHPVRRDWYSNVRSLLLQDCCPGIDQPFASWFEPNTSSERKYDLPRLQYLVISDKRRIADGPLLSLAHCQSLQKATIVNYGIASLPSSLQALKYSFQAGQAAPSLVETLSSCQELRHLTVDGHGLEGHALSALLRHRPLDLRSINVGPRSCLSNLDVEALLCCNNLQALELRGLADITGGPLVRLVNALRNPETGKAAINLSVDDCPNIAVDALDWLRANIDGKFSAKMTQVSRSR
ncbi:uncharacterized protein L969DRAFT_48962 [Mixia osmundae IAM 14324]|uniref:F-box domain-containing protein n=1 Tax=Mixia osmundae (strain CBS 9802 / IAM 14324 / JCM 22182 / KY 12970) TaxID=764103 RepID=G7DVQ1_MIXOS|nr:uncharacterized protein L969DRAFT_48962 [Mixia osmundae IAM 14324]KEI39657.1 hypothetical protein L969DRAFT_48962 [Mixia osmundae IAM 14324]GAA94661.1 hypothetical protein E5Q_01314 [Mixia osmundae IAM 14324]